MIEQTPRNPEALYRLAAVEASLGMSEDAVTHLRKGINSGWIDYRSFAQDPRFDAIRESLEVQTAVRDLISKITDMRINVQTTNIEE